MPATLPSFGYSFIPDSGERSRECQLNKMSPGKFYLHQCVHSALLRHEVLDVQQSTPRIRARVLALPQIFVDPCDFTLKSRSSSWCLSRLWRKHLILFSMHQLEADVRPVAEHIAKLYIEVAECFQATGVLQWPAINRVKADRFTQFKHRLACCFVVACGKDA